MEKRSSSVQSYTASGKVAFCVKRDELTSSVLEFRVDSLDERLHLISIEQAPAMFESRKRFVFRVDSQVQEELLDKVGAFLNGLLRRPFQGKLP